MLANIFILVNFFYKEQIYTVSRVKMICINYWCVTLKWTLLRNWDKYRNKLYSHTFMCTTGYLCCNICISIPFFPCYRITLPSSNLLFSFNVSLLSLDSVGLTYNFSSPWYLRNVSTGTFHSVFQIWIL